MTEFLQYISDVYTWFVANDGWRTAGIIWFMVYIIGGFFSLMFIGSTGTWKSSLQRASILLFGVVCVSLVLTSWATFAAYDFEQSAISRGCVRIEYNDSPRVYPGQPTEYRPTYRCPDGTEL